MLGAAAGGVLPSGDDVKADNLRRAMAAAEEATKVQPTHRFDRAVCIIYDGDDPLLKGKSRPECERLLRTRHPQLLAIDLKRADGRALTDPIELKKKREKKGPARGAAAPGAAAAAPAAVAPVAASKVKWHVKFDSEAKRQEALLVPGSGFVCVACRDSPGGCDSACSALTVPNTVIMYLRSENWTVSQLSQPVQCSLGNASFSSPPVRAAVPPGKGYLAAAAGSWRPSGGMIGDLEKAREKRPRPWDVSSDSAPGPAEVISMSRTACHALKAAGVRADAVTLVQTRRSIRALIVRLHSKSDLDALELIVYAPPAPSDGKEEKSDAKGTAREKLTVLCNTLWNSRSIQMELLRDEGKNSCIQCMAPGHAIGDCEKATIEECAFMRLVFKTRLDPAWMLQFERCSDETNALRIFTGHDFRSHDTNSHVLHFAWPLLLADIDERVRRVSELAHRRDCLSTAVRNGAGFKAWAASTCSQCGEENHTAQRCPLAAVARSGAAADDDIIDSAWELARRAPNAANAVGVGAPAAAAAAQPARPDPSARVTARPTEELAGTKGWCYSAINDIPCYRHKGQCPWAHFSIYNGDDSQRSIHPCTRRGGCPDKFTCRFDHGERKAIQAIKDAAEAKSRADQRAKAEAKEKKKADKLDRQKAKWEAKAKAEADAAATAAAATAAAATAAAAAAATAAPSSEAIAAATAADADAETKEVPATVPANLTSTGNIDPIEVKRTGAPSPASSAAAVSTPVAPTPTVGITPAGAAAALASASSSISSSAAVGAAGTPVDAPGITPGTRRGAAKGVRKVAAAAAAGSSSPPRGGKKDRLHDRNEGDGDDGDGSAQSPPRALARGASGAAIASPKASGAAKVTVTVPAAPTGAAATPPRPGTVAAIQVMLANESGGATPSAGSGTGGTRTTGARSPPR